MGYIRSVEYDYGIHQECEYDYGIYQECGHDLTMGYIRSVGMIMDISSVNTTMGYIRRFSVH